MRANSACCDFGIFSIAADGYQRLNAPAAGVVRVSMVPATRSCFVGHRRYSVAAPPSVTVSAARRALGTVGAFLPNIPFTAAVPMRSQREAILRLEQAGYLSAWVNEGAGGKDALVQAAALLAASETITLGTAVASIWARPPQTAHGAAAVIADAFPGRFILGLGVGYPEQAAATGRDFGKPLETIRRYVAQMDVGEPISPAPDVSYPRILAANGPKMLALAGEIADGAVPVLVPVEYTRRARELLGTEKLLVLGLTVVVESNVDRARDTARTFTSAVVGRPGSPYAVNLARLGYTTEGFAAPSDRVVDAIVAYGGPDEIAAAAQAHLDAGADHVRLAVTSEDFATGTDQLEWIAHGQPRARLESMTPVSNPAR